MNYIVVLVEPEGNLNLGSICRAMANFNLSVLRLVNPKADKNSSDAKAMAMHAQNILENSEIYNSIEDALRDCDLKVATTAAVTHPNSNVRPFMTPKKFEEKFTEKKGKCALIFGRESSGLTNDEIKKTDLLLHIPASKNYTTLNIAQAAVVIFYELASERKFEKENLAKAEQKQKLDDLFGYLVDLYQPNDKGAMMKHFRRVINKAGINEREANTLIGVFNKIQKRDNK